MSPGIVLGVFGLIFVAEIPDKTMVATLILGSRHRPVLVWIGAVAAFAVQVALAVAAGRAVGLLPHRWVEGLTALLFGAGALYLLVVPERRATERAGTAVATGERRGWRTVATAFAVIAVGELGDLTQILTADLSARYHQPVSVFVGAFGALAVVSAIGAFGGNALLRVVPVERIRMAGGVVLAGLAVYSAVSLLRG